MNKKILSFYYLTIILLFFGSYYILGTDISIFYKKILIVGLCALKTLFFMINVIKKEIDLFDKEINGDKEQYSTILLSVFLIIISYSLDYFLLYSIDITCFQPLLKEAESIKLLWNSFYYSSMIFFWMGIADLNVNCSAGQFITWAESMVTFFILSYGTFKFLKH